MTLNAGTRLGPYTVETAIGAGAMGEVYRARDTRLDRDVAVKVLPAHLARNAGAVARFEREARAIAALAHPNILAIFDVGTAGDVSYTVTELLQGQTLREALAGGALPVRQALDFALQISRGLAAAHEKGISHRDLKPENIFVTRGGLLKILDFGLAQIAATTSGESMGATAAPDTSPGMVLGTVGYMSPEQVRGQPTDHRTDIFAFGALLFEMLAGRRAFRGDTAADKMAAVVRDDAPGLLTVNASLPPALARIVARALEKDPARRFQSAHDLGLAIEAITEHRSSGPTAALPPDDLRAIVVLPFADISPEHDNAFFADGLTEEIISDLAKLRGLRVISRTSAMQLKGRQHDIPSIARELNVRYVLEGSVRKAGSRLRITIQLIDALADAHLWSEKFNGTLDDVFEIQEQVARAIAGELKIKLSPEESREMARRPIGDPRAYEAYMRARAETLRFTPEGLQRALRELDTALELVGENALLLTARGEALWQQFNLGVTTDYTQLDKVDAIAARVDTLEPGSRHASRLRALVGFHRGNLQETTRQIKRVLQIDANDPFDCMTYIFGCGLGGHPAASRAIAAHLRKMDPLQALSHIAAEWSETYMEGRFEEALVGYERAYRMDPENPPVVLFYVLGLGAAGRVAEAIAAVDRIAREQPGTKWTWLCQAFKWGLLGDATTLHASLTPELRDWCAHDAQYSQLLAEAYALAGRPDEAFEWLEIMLRLGACPYQFLAIHSPFVARLRSDRRWAPFLQRVREACDRFEA